MVWTKVEQRRWEAIEALVREKPEVFAVQGWIQTVGKRRRLRYRDGGVVRSLCLGRSQELADRVAELLRWLHAAERSRRFMKRLCRQARKGRRLALAVIDAMLDHCGELAEPPERDALDEDWLDDVQDPRLHSLPWPQPQSHPTGGKALAHKEPFFDGVVPNLMQDQSAELFKTFEAMLQAGANSSDQPDES